MHLWTEYEGNTLAGYPVGRLSRSEGRSAFFLTVAEGQNALLRLTESHFDEGELIGRWKKAAAVSHPGLQAVRKWGQTTFDGVPLAYCVLEPNDASLSDVLRERVLSAEEAAEVAEAVAGALATLHGAGLVHGHVDAINVFAMGEAVKLRTDCVRECVGDFEADTEEARMALRQRDVHDLGLLLRRCLTPQWEESAAMQLPSPFDRIVRRALNGTIDAAGIVEEIELLKPAKPVEPVRVTANSVPSVVPSAAATQSAVASPRPTVRAASVVPEPLVATGAKAVHRGVGSLPPRVNMSGQSSPAAISAMLADREPLVGGRGPARVADPGSGTVTGERIIAGEQENEAPASLPLRVDRIRNRLRQNTGMAARGRTLQAFDVIREQAARHKVWAASAAVAAVLAFVVWSTTGAAHGASATPSPAHHVADSSVASNAAAPSSKVASSTVTPKADRQTSLLSTGERAGWYVIAYTYRYEKQAAAKATQLKERYTGMQPQVYSPTGRAPYFVALGGPSDSVSAYALRDRARRAGLPRDTYARNF